MAAPNLSRLAIIVSVAFVRSSEGLCGGKFTSATGTIQSPGFPANYSNEISCIYVITAPSDQRITLNFTHFDLEPHGVYGNTFLCHDYLEVRDGNSITSPRLGRFCNNTLPDAVRSFGSQMWIRFFTDVSINGTGFRATYTTDTYDNSFLLFTSDDGSIHRLDLETHSNVILPLNMINPIAVDYDPLEGKVYWTEVGDTINHIASASLNGSSLQVVMHTNTDASLEGMAIDALSRLLFYTDAGNDVIGMVTLSIHAHRTIINSSLDKPRAIVLHTADGIMFWTDRGDPSRIERANYDGSDRKTLVDHLLSDINALALDVANSRLYWADGGTDRVESVNLQGGDRPLTPLLHLVSSRHFFGMALFRNDLYLSDWGPDRSRTTLSLFIRQPVDGGNFTIEGSIGQRMGDIHAYDQNSAMTGPNGCGNNNGGCSVMCIPLPGNSRKCMCPDGQSLSIDNTACLTGKEGGSGKEGSGQEGSGKEGSGQEGSRQEGSGQTTDTDLARVIGGAVGGFLSLVIVVVVVVVVIVKCRKPAYEKPSKKRGRREIHDYAGLAFVNAAFNPVPPQPVNIVQNPEDNEIENLPDISGDPPPVPHRTRGKFIRHNTPPPSANRGQRTQPSPEDASLKPTTNPVQGYFGQAGADSAPLAKPIAGPVPDYFEPVPNPDYSCVDSSTAAKPSAKKLAPNNLEPIGNPADEYIEMDSPKSGPAEPASNYLQPTTNPVHDYVKTSTANASLTEPASSYLQPTTNPAHDYVKKSAPKSGPTEPASSYLQPTTNPAHDYVESAA